MKPRYELLSAAQEVPFSTLVRVGWNEAVKSLVDGILSKDFQYPRSGRME